MTKTFLPMEKLPMEKLVEANERIKKLENALRQIANHTNDISGASDMVKIAKQALVQP
jgi:hypothetical protein